MNEKKSLIKIGIRNNLFYPLMLIIFIFLRRVVEILIPEICGKPGPFLYPALIFISKFIFGLISMYITHYIKKSNKLSKIMRIELIQSNNEIHQEDSTPKIFILIFFASYFDFLAQ